MTRMIIILLNIHRDVYKHMYIHGTLCIYLNNIQYTNLVQSQLVRIIKVLLFISFSDHIKCVGSSLFPDYSIPILIFNDMKNLKIPMST